MRRATRIRLVVAALLLAVTANAAVALPAAGIDAIRAVSGCAHHCDRMWSLGEAARCCGVASPASDPARVPAAPAAFERPAASLLALLPVAAPVRAPATREAPVLLGAANATGPPVFLRLLTLQR